MNFTEKKNEFFDRLGENCYMVLATTHNDYPLASMMTCVVFDGAIWMQTDKKFPKYDQIKNNSQVALCKGPVQIEGKALLCGHPLDEGNEKFAEMLKKYYPDSYEMYSKVETEVVIKIIPEKAIDWLYEKGDSCIYHLDFVNEKVDVQIYKNSK
ncbi:MAG: pyridoxamine 5'-phosphate oxidase family protein [Oscillospiraceae bacterium]|nr:pyridoxamine 5'-phosphate oxidase family protein [Oscillospiraceae bacterium]